MNTIAKCSILLVTLFSLAALSAPAQALVVAGGGGRVGSLDPDAGDGGLALGAHVDMQQAGSHWHLEPNVLYWNGNPLNGFDTNLDALYHFDAQNKTGPYLGGGVGMSMVDHERLGGTETDALANMFGGVMFPSGSNNLFLEGRYTVSDVSQASISFGVTLH